MDLSRPDGYDGLKHWLDERGADAAVLYLAISPQLFPGVCKQLGAAGLNGPRVRVCSRSGRPCASTTISARRRSRTLFVRSDEQEHAWRWVEPVLDAWRHDPQGPRPYGAGTLGPAAASALVARDGHSGSEEQ